jgi:hypothetical protein
MTILIEILGAGKFNGKSIFKEKVEGTPQYLAGYKAGVIARNKIENVISTVLEN